jgi:predicted TIM-barrel fold metal-dependent hydrolase
MISIDGRIDVHHHVATENHPLYELPGPRIWWSEDEALKMMDKNDVSVAMLSHTGRLPQNPRTIKAMMAIRDSPLGRTKPMRAAMRKAAHHTNLAAAETASRHPDRFGFFATIMLLDPDDAIAEASFALDKLGAEGLFMPTNIGPVYLGDPRYDSLFAELDRRGSVVFVHPMALPCSLIPGIPAHVCDFLLSTVRAATTLVRNGVPQRFPAIRFILTHSGGFIPYAVQRMSLTLSPLMEGRSPDSVLADYRSFYFDTAVATAPETIAGLLAFADPARIVFGTDFPFTQPDEVTFFARQLDELQLDTRMHQAISRTNAAALFPRLRHD